MSQFDASIPVLTEVFRDEPAPPPVPADTAFAPAATEATAASTDAAAAAATADDNAIIAPSAAPARAWEPFAGAALTSPGAWRFRSAAASHEADSGAEPARTEQAAPAPAAPPSSAAETVASAPVAPPAEPGPIDWALMERDISQRILQQLTARVDFVLEQRIKDSMEEVLTTALHGLTTEIRAGLHETIGKIVARAVQQEITHLQASAPRTDDKR